MGIFNSKQDETTTITPGSSATATPSSASDASTPAVPIDTNSTPSTPDTTTSADKETAPILSDSVENKSDDLAVPVAPSSESADDTATTPVTSTESEPSNTDTVDTPATEVSSPLDLPETSPVSTTIKVEDSVTDTPAPSINVDSSDLSDIKDQAIKQLSPLVGLLDQDPEEKFHTTMMMLQSTDDKSLIKSAYEVAQQITDEKAKAQALLDVVNEINYFTQQSENKN